MTPPYPHIDPDLAETVLGLAPARAASDIAAMPVSGTGLAGRAYAPGTRINDIEDVVALRAGPAQAQFVADRLAYGARDSETTLAEFLGEHGEVISGDGDLEMGPSALVLTGHVFIPAGVHEIAIRSDDGFRLSLGGVEVMSFEGRRAVDETSRVIDFGPEGGLYEIELLYFDAGGKMVLGMEIDGLPVDASAFHQTTGDVDAAGPGIPTEAYHPSRTLGAAALDDGTSPAGTPGRDVLRGDAGDEEIAAGDGDDEVHGGYGHDRLDGGAGADVLDGGRGADWLIGGPGDDLLVVRSDAGEQRIGQLAIGQPSRPDPDGEVNPESQKLKGWEDQPLVSDDILEGGPGRDTFLVTALLNAKLDIIQKHVRPDGTINWARVAGENDELHDHWTDSFGIVTIADYAKDEDTLAIIGHTATIEDVAYVDTDGDGDEETVITVISQQGDNGGAHDEDLIGQIVVHGDKVAADDIRTDAGVTYGIVETYAEVAEALFPIGDGKAGGYDTRDAGGGLGTVTGSPWDDVDNPYLAAASARFADPAAVEPKVELTRDPFGPLPVLDIPGETATGGAGPDLMAPAALPDAFAPPVLHIDAAAFSEGRVPDTAGGPAMGVHRLWENQALLRDDARVEGPDGTLSAISFDGEADFAFVPHSAATAITQGTIAIWVRPDDLSDTGAFWTKDQRNTGDGGHVRLGHTKEGGLFLRFAPGDGDRNKAWETGPILSEGEWQHIAVSFGAAGVTVHLDGQAVPDGAWTARDGDVPTPGVYAEAFLLMNEEPWVLGADQRRTEVNATALEFGVDDEDLENPLEGALAGFAVFGGHDPEDVLTPAEIAALATPGFDPAAIPAAPAEAIRAGDDAYSGGGGDDTLFGEGGDDTLAGEDGDDSLEGGYGDDSLDGGAGNDTLDGGRGSDLVIGGPGDDVLWSRADAGEDRAGQLVLGAPSRPFPDPQISSEYLKLVDWIDQPLVADDILVGGPGADEFRIRTLINGDKEAILDNLEDDSRDIRWHGVAGENDRIHDHWVDSIGIDVISDFEAADRISIIGHTTQIEIDYKGHDYDGDGAADGIVSVVTLYSQQGNNGGAHDEDILGYLVVHGELVTEEMIETDAGAHHGIVDTVDELQEAFAPTGETKLSEWQGRTLFGYDSRDVEGDPIGSDPEAFAENPYAGEVIHAGAGAPFEKAGLLQSFAGRAYDGTAYDTLPHVPALAREAGAIAFTFSTDAPDLRQAILSKDHGGNGTGGHFTAWIDGGRLKVRFQDDASASEYLVRSERIEANESYSAIFSYDADSLALYVNGALAEIEDGFDGGMSGNAEETLVGASARRRRDEDDNAEWEFRGEIGSVGFLDRPAGLLEAILLHEAGGDLSAIAAPVGDDVAVDPADAADTTPPPAPPPPGPLLDVFLADTDSDAVIAPITDGATVGAETIGTAPTALFALPSEHAGAWGEEIGSVRITTAAGTQTENIVPYAQFGDRGGDLEGDAGFGIGTHGVTLEIFSERGAGGELLQTLTLDFEITAPPPAEPVAPPPPPAEDPQAPDDAPADADEPDDPATPPDDTPDATDDGDNAHTEPDDDADTGEDDGDAGTGDPDAADGPEADGGDSATDDPDKTGETGEDTGRTDSDAPGDEDGDSGDSDTGDNPAAPPGDDGTPVGDPPPADPPAPELLPVPGSDADDLLRGGTGPDLVEGGAGDDRLLGRGGDDVISGGDGDDRALGQDGDDTIEGGNGDDRLNAGAGDDVVTGGVGDDRIVGRQGRDLLSGGDGDDFLNGGDDADTIEGGEGDDRLVGGSGPNTLAGGAGDDVYILADPGDMVVELDGEGRDVIRSTVDVTLAPNVEALGFARNGDGFTGIGNGLDNRIVGSDAPDILSGLAGDDVLVGLAGGDSISGGDGDDRLVGRAGSDTLAGGAGNDRLIGGEGGDSFLFAEAGALAADRVVDFTAGEDAILLAGAAFGGLSGPVADLLAFGRAAAETDDRLVYDASRGMLSHDPDGTGPEEPLLVARFRSDTVLDADDILIV